jgi:hypothetical protein
MNRGVILKISFWSILICMAIAAPSAGWAIEVRIFGGVLSLPNKYLLDLELPEYTNDGIIVFTTVRHSISDKPVVYTGAIDVYSLNKQTIHSDGAKEMIQKHRKLVTSTMGFKQLVIDVVGEKYKVVLFFDDKVVLQIIDQDPEVWREVLTSFRK